MGSIVKNHHVIAYSNKPYDILYSICRNNLVLEFLLQQPTNYITCCYGRIFFLSNNFSAIRFRPNKLTIQFWSHNYLNYEILVPLSVKKKIIINFVIFDNAQVWRRLNWGFLSSWLTWTLVVKQNYVFTLSIFFF